MAFASAPTRPGLKAIAKKNFDKKVFNTARPRLFAQYAVVDGKANGIPLAILEAEVVKAGNHWSNDGQQFRISTKK